MKKFCLALLGICLCVLSVGAAFAAMSDGEFFELCKNGSPQQVQAAIKAGANVNAKDEYGMSSLMQAAMTNSNPEVVTILIKSGADVNARNHSGATPLILAALGNSNPEVITELIKAGSDVNAKTKHDMTALEAATLNKTAAKDQIIAILKEHAQQQPKAEQGENTKPTDEEFITLCRTGTPQQVQTAIKSGADVNARDDIDRTPLMLAAANNINHEVITALINAGANVNAEDKGGNTALIAAAEKNANPKVIATLIQSGSNANAKDREGDTALMIAVMFNPNHEVVATLIKLGANVNTKDQDGLTALDYAREITRLQNTEAYRMLESMTRK